MPPTAGHLEEPGDRDQQNTGAGSPGREDKGLNTTSRLHNTEPRETTQTQRSNAQEKKRKPGEQVRRRAAEPKARIPPVLPKTT